MNGAVLPTVARNVRPVSRRSVSRLIEAIVMLHGELAVERDLGERLPVGLLLEVTEGLVGRRLPERRHDVVRARADPDDPGGLQDDEVPRDDRHHDQQPEDEQPDGVRLLQEVGETHRGQGFGGMHGWIL